MFLQNSKVIIKILGNIIIDNKNYADRNAIMIDDGATLDLYIYGNVIVTSGYGVAGEQGNRYGVEGGIGGRAGINVTDTSVLNLFINDGAEITCIVGKAGNGGAGLSGTYGGRRWRWSWSYRKC